MCILRAVAHLAIPTGTCFSLTFSASVRLHGHEISVAVMAMSHGLAEPGVKEQAREGSTLSSSLPMAVTFAGHFAVQYVSACKGSQIGQ